MNNDNIIIRFDKDKIKEKYLKEIINTYDNVDVNSVIKCLEYKWDINRVDTEQGFDSDCTIHCKLYDICYKILEDKECIK